MKIEQPAHIGVRVVHDRFQAGDTLSRALLRHDIPGSEIHAVGQCLSQAMDLGKIRTGVRFTLTFSEATDHLIGFEILKSRKVNIVMQKSEEQWMLHEVDIPFETALHVASNTIDVSLWNACKDAGIPSSLILDTADLFGAHIDFASDLRKDDAFCLFYEMEIYPDDSFHPGEIKAAKFTNQNTDFYAVQFTLPDGFTDYFDSNGDSLRRSFLKSPLRYRYISSGFSYKRFHPVLKIYRPHLGIDYAAASGTPVSALGDGIVIFSGRKGGYGKYVQIKHGEDYITCYGHLSGYGKGIKKGVRVQQGQIIGYVGSTGLATGPHLDFRVQHRGKFINPLKLKSTPARPVPDECRGEFELKRDYWVQKLNEIQS